MVVSGSGVQFTETMRGFASTSAIDDYADGLRAGQGRRLAAGVHRHGDRGRRRPARRRARARGPPGGHGDRAGTLPHAAEGRGRPVQPADPRRGATLRPGRCSTRCRSSPKTGGASSSRASSRSETTSGLDLWKDTTTLYVTVHEGDAERPGRGQGHRDHPRRRLRQADDDDAGRAGSDGEVQPDVRRLPQRDLRRRLRPAEQRSTPTPRRGSTGPCAPRRPRCTSSRPRTTSSSG